MLGGVKARDVACTLILHGIWNNISVHRLVAGTATLFHNGYAAYTDSLKMQLARGNRSQLTSTVEAVEEKLLHYDLDMSFCRANRQGDDSQHISDLSAQDQPPAQAPPGPVPRPQAPPWGRWLDRDTNPCLNFQRIGESMQRPLELCSYEGLMALHPIGKEYQQGYKRVNDRLPKIQTKTFCIMAASLQPRATAYPSEARRCCGSARTRTQPALGLSPCSWAQAGSAMNRTKMLAGRGAAIGGNPDDPRSRHRGTWQHIECPRHRSRRTLLQAGGDSDDIVTTIVGKIFGQKALEDRTPFGMARMDWSKVKDLEVVLDRDALPVADDDPTMAQLRPMLAGTSLESEPLRLAYCAETDGWRPDAFHAAVSGYGPCLIWARTAGGAVCGGYNPLGFEGFGADKASMGAFLFSVLCCGPGWLPPGLQFGAGDFKVPLMRGRNATKATSKLLDYARPASGARSLFSPEEGRTAQLVELRAYVRNGGKLKYELDGELCSSICLA
ncbi:hypothetical protein QJQ45_017680 [Haematococcus lacustris]|nr:hypothetical protein QJQ45_017680 [Haematococcus lacustris]